MRKSEKNFLIFTVIINGFAILVIEIMGSRVLAPFYGSTIYVWSALISATMASLAAGYFFGGWIADKSKNILSNLYSHLFYSGIFIVLIPQLAPIVLINTNILGIKTGPMVASLLLFAFPLFLMGTVAPIAIKAVTKDMVTLGVRAGTIYAVATTGSLIGSIVTGFYLAANYFASTVFYMTGALLIVIYFFQICIKKY